MKRTRTLGGSILLLLAALAWTNPSGGGESAEQTESAKIAALIRQLGAEDFHVRDKANQELLRIGLPARQALLHGVGDADLEIRKRCRELLPAIAEADRRAKLAAFIADKDGKQEHDLPGWSRYRKIVGEDAAARQFFVVIQNADVGLLNEVEKDRGRACGLCVNRCQNLLNKQYEQIRMGVVPTPIRIEDIAPLMLVTADAEVSIPAPHRWQFGNLLQQQSVRSELQGDRSTPFKKIALAWMARRLEDEETAQIAFDTINSLQLKEGLDLVLKAVRGKKLSGSAMAHALMTIGRLGDKKHLSLLESFLDDKTNFCSFGIGRGGGNVQGTTEVCDVALAMLIRLTKQSYKDYGFALTKVKFEHLMNNADYLGFSSDKERDAALAKWKAWKAAQKK